MTVSAAFSAREFELRLTSMPEPWASVIRPIFLESSARGLFLDQESGAVLAGPRPTLGKFAFEIVLFPPASQHFLAEYEQRLNVVIPDVAKEYLCAFNGARFFEFGISGADPFYARDPWPHRQPLYHCSDIGTDLIVRRRHDRNTAPILGSRNVSLEVVHNFVAGAHGEIHAHARDGDHVRTWPDPVEWLRSQIEEAAAFTSTWEKAMASLLNDA